MRPDPINPGHPAGPSIPNPNLDPDLPEPRVPTDPDQPTPMPDPEIFPREPLEKELPQQTEGVVSMMAYFQHANLVATPD